MLATEERNGIACLLAGVWKLGRIRNNIKLHITCRRRGYQTYIARLTKDKNV
jgi:ribosomal protein L37E